MKRKNNEELTAVEGVYYGDIHAVNKIPGSNVQVTSLDYSKNMLIAFEQHKNPEGERRSAFKAISNRKK